MHEKFFDELKNLHDERPDVCDKIKSHGLPVIIFGAGTMAQWVTELLKTYDVKIDGYAVDAEYFKPNQTYLNLPVYNFAELRTQPEKYVFVLGMNNDWLDGNRSWEFMQDAGIIRYALLDNGYELIDKDFIAQLWSVFRRGIYFNELTQDVRGKNYVDYGAFRGDTIERFIAWSGGRYGKIFAFEPDAGNFSALENFIRDKGYKNVALFNCGVWNEKCRLAFESIDTAYSAVSEAGNTTVALEKLNDVIRSPKV